MSGIHHYWYSTDNGPLINKEIKEIRDSPIVGQRCDYW